jgi:hypothetical protein
MPVSGMQRKEESMKTKIALMMVLALAVALSGTAYAADTAAPAPAAPATAAPAAPAAKPAHEGVEATVKGTVAGKTVTRKGKEIKMYEVTVAEAKGADGKAIDGLKGQALRLGPKEKAEEIAKFDGKTAEISGKIVEGKKAGTKMLRVETIK